MQFVELGYIFIVGSSLVLLFIVCAFALRNLNIAGSKAFVLQIVCVTIWSLGSLFEMLSETEQSMLLWRNIEQIGIFLLPVACVYFAVDYSGYDRLKKHLPLLLVIPCVAILLIFTDSSTHLMRTDTPSALAKCSAKRSPFIRPYWARYLFRLTICW
jgi:hypothetical protein